MGVREELGVRIDAALHQRLNAAIKFHVVRFTAMMATVLRWRGRATPKAAER